MRQQRRIDNADQQLFRQPQLRLWADLQVAIKVGAEDPKLRRLGDVLLAAGQRDQTFTQRRVSNTDDGGALSKTRGRCRLRAGDNLCALFVAHGGIGEVADGTVAAQQLNGRRHYVFLCQTRIQALESALTAGPRSAPSAT